MEKAINSKVNLLLVVCNNVMNGSERYAVDIAKNLPQEIFNIKFATPSAGLLSEILEKNNIDELIYHNDKIGKYTLKGLLNLRKIIKSNNISIVHSNAKFFPCLIGKLSGVKLNIETVHGIFFSDDQLNSLPYWRKIYGFIIQHFVDCYIAISLNDRKRLIEKFHINKKRIVVIYNGIDESNIKIEKEINETKITNEILIGTIGRFTFQKAQLILIEAFSLLIKENKFTNIKLELIGDGECREEINNLVDSLKLNKYVKIISYSKNIFSHFKEFDIFVLTSRFEGVPYVLLEAMHLGIPIVTTDVGGINNVLTNNYDAILTKPEDPASTKNALRLLIEDGKLRKQLSKNARETIKKYSIGKMIRPLMKVYLDSVTIKN